MRSENELVLNTAASNTRNKAAVDMNTVSAESLPSKSDKSSVVFLVPREQKQQSENENGQKCQRSVEH